VQPGLPSGYFKQGQLIAVGKNGIQQFQQRVFTPLTGSLSDCFHSAVSTLQGTIRRRRASVTRYPNQGPQFLRSQMARQKDLCNYFTPIAPANYIVFF
jgi:hypothetical protein